MTNTNNDSAYSPDQVGQLALAQIEHYQRHPGWKTGYSNLDAVMNPMRPGQLIPVLGNTNNFKSGFMGGVCQNVAAQVGDDQVVIYVSWEDSVESVGIKNLAAYSRIPVTAMVRGALDDGQWRRLRRAAVERARQPLWLIGHTNTQFRRRERLTLRDVWRMLDYLVDMEKKQIALVALDYLQRIRPHTPGDRRNQMMQIVDLATDMAIAFGTPVMLGTQAGRQVLERRWKLPQMHDAQETSNIEQSASAFLSLYMPAKTHAVGSVIEIAGQQVTVTKDLLIVALLKQKDGPAPHYFLFRIDFATNKLHPVDFRVSENGTEQAEPWWQR